MKDRPMARTTAQTQEQQPQAETGSVLDTLDAKANQAQADAKDSDGNTDTGEATSGQPAEPERTKDGGNGQQFEPAYDPELRAALAKLLANEKVDGYTLVPVSELQDRQDVFSTGLRTDRNGRQVELCRIL